MTLASITNWPQLDHPALVLGLEGWVDAGYAGGTAITALLESTPHEVVATFDADALLDHGPGVPPCVYLTAFTAP